TGRRRNAGATRRGGAGCRPPPPPSGTGGSGRCARAAPRARRAGLKAAAGEARPRGRDSGRYRPRRFLTEIATPKAPFQPFHRAAVRLVVVAEAVEHAVEQQDPQLALAVVPGLGPLPARPGHRDQDVAEVPAAVFQIAGKGEHVGRRVLAAEGPIGAPERGLAGQPDAEALRGGGEVRDHPFEPGPQAARRTPRIAIRVLDRDLAGPAHEPFPPGGRSEARLS